MRLLELFSGVGSFSLGMKRNGIDHEIVGFSDIRESAVKLFCKLHDKKTNDNLGDITKLSAIGMEVDIITYGSPCQSFSRSGKGGGGEKGSDTKSSLMWEAVRVIEEVKPNFVIWENVPDAISKKNIGNFETYMEVMDEMGYNTYYKVINAYKNGSIQKRSRLFAISINKDIDNGNFKFIEEELDVKKDINKYLVSKGDQSLLVEHKVSSQLILGETEKGLLIKNATITGYIEAFEGDIVDTSFPNSKTRRGRVQKNAVPTLIRSKTMAVVENKRLRYLSPKEYWLVQEMPINLYDHVVECDFKEREMYDVIGGVINQKHMDVVFKSLKEYINNNEKLKRS